jgi:hypothetical protein
MTENADDNFDLYRDLASHAAHLNAINRDRLFGVPYYEIWSGALIWTDETNWRTPFEVKSALRIVWAFRTSLMLNNERCCASAACEIDLNHEFCRLMSIIFVIRRVAGIFHAFNHSFDQVFIFVSSAFETRSRSRERNSTGWLPFPAARRAATYIQVAAASSRSEFQRQDVLPLTFKWLRLPAAVNSTGKMPLPRE